MHSIIALPYVDKQCVNGALLSLHFGDSCSWCQNALCVHQATKSTKACNCSTRKGNSLQFQSPEGDVSTARRPYGARQTLDEHARDVLAVVLYCQQPKFGMNLRLDN